MITVGDSGIGRAVAIAFAREGADVLISYLSEHDDAAETKRLVEAVGQRAVLVPGDISDPAHCRDVITKAVEAFGRVDVLVNNAAHQASFEKLEDIEDAEWDHTFAVNIHAMFYLVKAALPHIPKGGAIINTTSINADKPNASLLAYATTKGAIHNFTAGLAQMLAERGIRRARAGLDPADPRHHAARRRKGFRHPDADRPRRTAGRTRPALCAAHQRRGELRFRCHDPRHRRHPPFL